ncbi:predicted protein [Histoplasma mississippiense (nom. inval.)]|uniref:predicted protein n=1 Tax=Ajellomyces capsulatus (strain NAm1 / WU24) TaxID=2059318 RepID=UPI000157B585|nr:predicted protein [Histoplasma mississippiense (nom. inval.)]EDN02405.1 predicted protein [Histoplasma mississippiense (nom. inval.)]
MGVVVWPSPQRAWPLNPPLIHCDRQPQHNIIYLENPSVSLTTEWFGHKILSPMARLINGAYRAWLLERMHAGVYDFKP